MKSLDLTGQTFGRLTVVRFDPLAAGAGRWWLCRCECGREKSVSAAHLRSGNIRSCGCLRAELGRAYADGAWTRARMRGLKRANGRGEP